MSAARGCSPTERIRSPIGSLEEHDVREQHDQEHQPDEQAQVRRPGTQLEEAERGLRDVGNAVIWPFVDSVRVDRAEQVAGEAEREQVDGEAADDLVGAQVDREERRGSSARSPPKSIAISEADDPAAAPDRAPDREEGADEHHPLEPDVHDAGALGEDAAHRRERERRREAERRGEEPAREDGLERGPGRRPAPRGRRSFRGTQRRSQTRPSRRSPWLERGEARARALPARRRSGRGSCGS